MVDKKKDDKIKDKDIEKAVKERIKAEAESFIPNDPDDVTPQFVRDCFLDNDRGDGTLLATLHRGRYLYNQTSNEWYEWTGHHWKLDDRETRYEAVEEVVKKYREEIDRLNEQISKAGAGDKEDQKKFLEKKRGQYYSRIRRLQGDGADKCLTWAHRIEGGLGIQGKEFDRNGWLLACNNGVIELKTGRFRAGRPEDYLIRAVEHDWPEEQGGIDCKAPSWEKFLGDVFGEDKEIAAYICRLFGYGMTGITEEMIFPVMHGVGRNGKGTLVETLNHVLGELSGPIQSEMLLDQRAARSSAGSSPDIMNLKGLRIAFASETDENRRFSPSRVKWLTGGDSLTGRNPYDRYETTFNPTHLLCLLTNHIPQAPGDDYAFWQRMHLIPFNFSFVDNPSADNERARDKTLPERLKAEAPGILAWLVRGCIAWQREGLNPPRVILNATERQRINEDTIAGFVGDCCIEDPDEKVQYKKIYEAFQGWYDNNLGDHSKYGPKKKKFSGLLEKRFKKDTVGGQVHFFGLRLKTNREIEDGEGDSQDL